MATHERKEGRTPNGGDYSEIFYLDRDHNPAEPDRAYEFIVWECRKDGTIINTIRGLMRE